MKKIIIIAAMMLGVAVAAVAQPRAIGIRGGYGIEASYQHTLGSANFIEADLGLASFNSLNVVATYNWMIANPQWTDRGEWGFYAGPGAAIGLGFSPASFFNIAAAGQVGIEYTFWFPLQISLDIRPQLGLVTASGASGFYFGGWYPSFGARYRF